MHSIRRTWAAVLLGAALGWFGSVNSAAADDWSNSELVQRIEALEAELEQQQTQFASYTMGGEQKVGECKGCTGGCGSCCPPPTCPSWSTSYETTILQPYTSNRLIGGGGFDNKYGIGHRLAVERDGGAGLGIRARYWFLNTNHAFVPPAPEPLGIDMDVLDVELTLRERLCNWDMIVSGGARYGRMELGCGCGAFLASFEGFGPTASLGARRDVGCRGLYLVGNFRGSLLVGDIANADNLLAGAPRIEDELTTVLSSQLGVGWAHLMGISEVHLRALWETQFWLNSTFADDQGAFASNLGLGGFTVGIELRR